MQSQTVLCMVLLSLFIYEAASSPVVDLNSSEMQDTLDENLPGKAVESQRDLAALYELLINAAYKDDQVVNVNYPQEILRQYLSRDSKEKRGSYMSLCHFKICNMGRKRSNWPWN